jgi:hypothetical protein
VPLADRPPLTTMLEPSTAAAAPVRGVGNGLSERVIRRLTGILVRTVFRVE